MDGSLSFLSEFGITHRCRTGDSTGIPDVDRCIGRNGLIAVIGSKVSGKIPSFGELRNLQSPK